MMKGVHEANKVEKQCAARKKCISPLGTIIALLFITNYVRIIILLPVEEVQFTFTGKKKTSLLLWS